MNMCDQKMFATSKANTTILRHYTNKPHIHTDKCAVMSSVNYDYVNNQMDGL